MVSVGGKEMIVWNTIEKKAVYHYRVEHCISFDYFRVRRSVVS